MIARVGKRARLKVLRRVAEHYLVRLPDMRQGYVAVDAVAAAPASSAASSVLRRESLPGVVEGEFVRASILRRFAARFIDSMLLCFVWFLLSLALLPSSVGEGGVSIGVAIYVPAGGLIGLLYEVVGIALGGTVGKSLLGVQVIETETGKAPGLQKSAIRYFVAALGGGALGLGLLWAFWNGGRTWHDMAAGTRVMRYR
jgi:uncharacterized RDD family membrane protein YckC